MLNSNYFMMATVSENMAKRFFAFLTLWAIIAVSSLIYSKQWDTEYNSTRVECYDKCYLQNKTNNHREIIYQCNRGCTLLQYALSSNCSKVCEKFNSTFTSQSKSYCITGCNIAINLYFNKMRSAIGPLPSPVLLSDSLSDKSLKLQWMTVKQENFKYKVQYKFENYTSWQDYQSYLWINDSVIKLENLRPYTNYQFRIAVLLRQLGEIEAMVSNSSVIIRTYPSNVPPSMKLFIMKIIPASSSISITWIDIPYSSEPILSYNLLIQESTKGYTMFKEIGTGQQNVTEHLYVFHNLESAKNYSITLSATNKYGIGPGTITYVKTLPTLTKKYTSESGSLILVSNHDIISKTKELIDSPINIYFTNQTINGASINIHKNIIYILDSSGSLLSFLYNEITILLSTDKEMLLDVTVDWLNNELYILMSSTKNSMIYYIKKFDLEQKKLMEIISEFDYKPSQIEVDPCNGYLFWLTKFGLYRLDLSKNLNNLTKNVPSTLLLQNKNIGSFVIDYLNFRLFVILENTIMSVSLDGQEVINIRQNTETSLFNDAISITYVQGLFYWTNGLELIGEEYSNIEQKYYQHIYPSLKLNNFYNLILSNFTDQQPMPFPRNPPQSLQAITSSNKLRAMWKIPQLSDGQGHNSWKKWSYQFSILFENETIWRNIYVNGTEIVIDSLIPSTNYVIRVAAYSTSGQGPWCSELMVKTLHHNVFIIWENAQHIFISDIMGEYVESIPLIEDDKPIKQFSLNDVTFYDNCIYYIFNLNKINWFNLTSQERGTLKGISSIKSMAIDWLGQKLYWADIITHSILRENLFGGQRELILTSDVAIYELKVESVGGYLYWTTGFSVKSSKLDGKNQQNYYNSDYFSGKKVINLAVDSVGHWVYWILRENDKSKLFRAPTAENLNDFVPSIIVEFDHLCTRGPLFNVDHHLLWLRNDNEIMMSYTDGQYPATIRAMNLHGIQTFSVLDSSNYLKPKGLETVVIPEELDIKMINVKSIDSRSMYEVNWESVKNVNHGLVSYTVNILKKDNSVYTVDTLNTQVLVNNTPIEISIKASTVWGSSQIVTVYSPIPTIPTDFQILITFNDDNHQTIDIILQHSPIENVTNFEIMCYYQEKHTHGVYINKTIVSTRPQTIWSQLAVNVNYLFKLRACSMVSCGRWSQEIILNEPSTIFSFKTSIIYDKNKMTFHPNKLKNQQIILQTNSLVTSFTLNDIENIAFWTDGTTIYSLPINKSINIKIYSTFHDNIEIENLSFDSISKTLFWCEITENQSAIMEFDFKTVKTAIRRPNKIFSPILSKDLFIWIENIPDSINKYILRSNNNSSEIFIDSDNKNCNCSILRPIENVLALYVSNSGKIKLLFIESEHQNIIVSDVNGCKCSMIFSINSTQNLTSLAIDKHSIYWTTNKSMCSIQINELNDTPTIKNNTLSYCLNNVTALFTINGLPELSNRPYPPGFPQVNQTLPSVYVVHWYPSESRVNYSLERTVISEPRNVKNLNSRTNDWTTVYIGPNNFWIMPDVIPGVMYKFRVKGENRHGWCSEYRMSDEFQFQGENMVTPLIIVFFFVTCIPAFFIHIKWWKNYNTETRPFGIEMIELEEMPQIITNEINVVYENLVCQNQNQNESNQSDNLFFIKCENVILMTQLSSGAFGTVYMGKIKSITPEETAPYVAVKIFNNTHQQTKIEDFMNEAHLMNKLSHNNIVHFIGISFNNGSHCIIMELMKEGSLLGYLKKHRSTYTINSNLNHIDLVRMCMDVASGCLYLEQMHIVHRDLACRNCLVSSSDPKERIIKIGDFGLSKNISNHNCYRENNGLMPIRWMAPESIIDGIFNSQTDVWAFGIVLWEIMSVGNNPYSGFTNENVMCHVPRGRRLTKPINCPDNVFNLMKNCWNVKPERRPRFEFILEALNSMLNTMLMHNMNTSHDRDIAQSSDPQPIRCNNTLMYTDVYQESIINYIDLTISPDMISKPNSI